MMWNEYSAGLLIVLISAVIGFLALARETDDFHRLLLIDLVEIPSLAIIALLGTDLAEALILPGLVVGISELLALSQLYIVKEGLRSRPVKSTGIEVIKYAHAPLIISVFLVAYGIVLSGFTGGGIAGLGVIFYIMARGQSERFEIVEMASGISWAVWIIAFFIFMFLPAYWYMAVMLAAVGILLKVAAKMSLMGTMWGAPDE
jgi:energy-converting hydrogenase A subunit G